MFAFAVPVADNSWYGVYLDGLSTVVCLDPTSGAVVWAHNLGTTGLYSGPNAWYLTPPVATLRTLSSGDSVLDVTTLVSSSGSAAGVPEGAVYMLLRVRNPLQPTTGACNHSWCVIWVIWLRRRGSSCFNDAARNATLVHHMHCQQMMTSPTVLCQRGPARWSLGPLDLR